VKRKHSVGYFSSYDRGLECLLDMWPEIHKRVSDATLDIYYGWDTFDAAHRSNPLKMKWKWQMIRKLYSLKDMGVAEHGRVSHEELAKAMKEIEVWAYPTEFTEIHCITALKAQEAGCYPIVTAVAALNETVQSGYKLKYDDIYTNKEAQQAFIAAVVDALTSDETTGNPVSGVYWTDVAKSWAKACV
jgi:glycosyltransferase involved in cell wall biosynthesis